MWKQGVGLMTIVMLSGCSSLMGGVPDGPIPVTVAEVQHAIECEIYYAFQSTGGPESPFQTWGAIVELSLNATDTSDIVPGLGALSAKVGNAKLSAKATSFTAHDQVKDSDDIAYAVDLRDSDDLANCPQQHSSVAANGLGLYEFLMGTANILKAHGTIFSSTALTDQEKSILGGIYANNAALLQLALAPEAIKTITYQRDFTINRSIDGGLTFQVDDISLSLDGSGNGRARTGNLITIKFGDLAKPSRAPVRTHGLGAAASLPEPGGAADALQQSVLDQRDAQLKILQQLPQGNVVVVNPATP